MGYMRLKVFVVVHIKFSNFAGMDMELAKAIKEITRSLPVPKSKKYKSLKLVFNLNSLIEKESF